VLWDLISKVFGGTVIWFVVAMKEPAEGIAGFTESKLCTVTEPPIELKSSIKCSIYETPHHLRLRTVNEFSVPNSPVRTAGPWRPIVPSVPGGVGMDGRARRPSSPFPERLQGPAVNLQSCS